MEHLYGSNVVKAAIRARKRTFESLLVYGIQGKDLETVKLARKANVRIEEVSQKGILNNLSGNRPHNGLVLKASMLTYSRVRNLGRVQGEDYSLEDTQERALKTKGRYPLWLYLDENFGALIRTAYLLGVDGIAVSEKNCASATPVVSKASSGALESMEVFATKALPFINRSQKNGWQFYAAVLPDDVERAITVPFHQLSQCIQRQPCVLLLGSEGHGLRTNVKRASDFHVSIPCAGKSDTVDCLNVR